MLYYLLLIPAVLSTAWIYFLSPALSTGGCCRS